MDTLYCGQTHYVHWLVLQTHDMDTNRRLDTKLICVLKTMGVVETRYKLEGDATVNWRDVHS